MLRRSIYVGSLVAFDVDQPVAGEWVYRVTVEEKANAGDMTIVVDNVRLFAREIGSAPS